MQLEKVCCMDITEEQQPVIVGKGCPMVLADTTHKHALWGKRVQSTIQMPPAGVTHDGLPLSEFPVSCIDTTGSPHVTFR
jgi:hypothetical protein